MQTTPHTHPTIYPPPSESKKINNKEFENDLIRVGITDNPQIDNKIDLVYVLAGRTTVLNQDADGLNRPIDTKDDFLRMSLGIEIADQVNALKTGKALSELTDKDRTTPIFYNGRPIHNIDLRRVLENPDLVKEQYGQNLPHYPKHLFIIDELHPKALNTLGQTKSFINLLDKNPHYKNVALVTSGFHIPRVARTFCSNSPQAYYEDGRPNALGQLSSITIFGVDRNHKNTGVESHDLSSEINAMENYSTGFDKTRIPTIAGTPKGNITFLGPIKDWASRILAERAGLFVKTITPRIIQ